MNHAALFIAELLLQIFEPVLEITHPEIAEFMIAEWKIRMPMMTRTKIMPLRHFFFNQFRSDFLFLSFAQERERHVCSFRITAHQLGQLIRFGENLII